MELVAPVLPAEARPITRTAYRINSIDLLRGLIMVIMALDHTRDFYHVNGFTGDPTNMETTTPFLFFTRWVTHFCAPVFIFLAGTSAYLQGMRKTKTELSGFLVKRGLWLILVEVFIMSLGISFDIYFSNIFLQTIWAIGISMVILGVAIWLPYAAILAVGAIIVFGHNLLDLYESGRQEFGVLYNIIHRPSFYPVGEGRTIGFLYPFLPWTGLMMLGYCLGKIFEKDQAKRKTQLVIVGLLVTGLFIVLRAVDVYGDPAKWSEQKNMMFTFMSFLNTTKYPPSLLYLCMTIGPALIFLSFAGNGRSRLAKIITVYGRVPFLYYVLHFYLIHLVASILFFARGHSFEEGLNGPPGFPFKFVWPGEGYSLGIVYLVWILIVAALYPVCKWYGEYKRKNKQWWLSYL